jgi:hypothetical protein
MRSGRRIKKLTATRAGSLTVDYPREISNFNSLFAVYLQKFANTL